MHDDRERSHDHDHIVLSPEQERFLARFLDYGKSGKGSGKSGKADADKRGKRADYKAFLGTEAAIEALCVRLAAEQIDVASIRRPLQELGAALQKQDQKNAPTLAQAFERAARLQKDAEALQQRLHQKQGVLSKLLWIGTPPPGASAAERQGLDRLCHAVALPLAGYLPTLSELEKMRKALLDIVDMRKVIVEACALRRRERAPVELALAELRRREADAAVRLQALDEPPDEAASLVRIVAEGLKAMDVGLATQSSAGLVDAKAGYGQASLAMSELEPLLANGFQTHARQAINEAGAGPFNMTLTALARANPGSFNSAVTALGRLSQVAGGELDDEALGRLEADLQRKAAALAAARRGVDAIMDEVRGAVAEAEPQDAPRGARGARAGRGEGARRGAMPIGGLGDPVAQLPDTAEARALKEKLEFARGQIEQREADLKRAERKADAGRAAVELVEALRSGPLSRGHGRELKPPGAGRLIELFGRDPAIARQCLASAGTADDPDAVVRCGMFACDAMQAGDGCFEGMDAQASADYAKKLVRSSASCDAATIDALPDYLRQRRMNVALDPGVRSGDAETRRKARTGHVRQAALQPDGRIDAAAGRAALLDISFHPDALREPSPMQASHMRRTLRFFEDTPEAQRELQSMAAPDPRGGGAALVRRSSGAVGDPGAQDARAALLNAMLTPVYQGEVGSCFATSGVIGLRETRPMEALRSLKEIAVEGCYRPRGGDPVPAVDNANVAGDPLVRSLEYSAATATAKAERSNKRKLLLERNRQAIVDGLPQGLIRGPGKVGPTGFPLPGDPVEPLCSRLAAAISKAVDFDYDPSRSTPQGADGHSESGVYVMRSTRTGQVITPDLAAIEARVRQDFAALGPDALDEAVRQARKQAESLAGDAYWAQIEPIVLEVMRDAGHEMGEAARAETKRFFLQSAADGDRAPWKPTAGGQTGEAAAVILGLDGREAALTKEVDPVGPGRTAEVMRKTMGGFVNRRNEGEAMVVMRTVGQHGFNGLPTHPSLAPLLDGGAEELEANFDRHVVRKGEALRETPLPVARLRAMYQRDARDLAGDDANLLQALQDGVPQDEMTPEQYRKHLDLALTMATPGGLRQPAEARRQRSAQVEVLVRARMIEALDVPQFVIADTNWGNDARRMFFVMLPDPLSGELKLMLRIDPGGQLQEPPGGAESWLRRSWATIS